MSKNDYSDYEIFYEELAFESGSYASYEELHKDTHYNQTGLNEEDVHKLTEDINNPLPPANHDD